MNRTRELDNIEPGRLDLPDELQLQLVHLDVFYDYIRAKEILHDGKRVGVLAKIGKAQSAYRAKLKILKKAPIDMDLAYQLCGENLDKNHRAL